MDRDTHGGSAGGKMYEGANDVRETAARAGEQLTDKAREVGHQVEDAAVSKAEEGRHRVAEEVHRVSEALRTGARQMRQGDEDRTTDFIERLAEPVERISAYLERHDTRQLASDLEGFARTNQAAFLGGAFVLGMMGARFLKASATTRNDSGFSGDGYGYDFERNRAPTGMRPQSGYVGETSYGAGLPRQGDRLDEGFGYPR